MNKDIHIVSGFIAKAVLTQSSYIDIERDEILCFTDSLNIGPLCDLNEPLHIIKRKKWFDNVLGPYYLDDNIHRLEKLIKSINKYDRIYMWLGDVDNEKLTTSWLLYHLQQCDIPVFKVNFDQIVYKNKIGSMVKVSSLSMIDKVDVAKIYWTFELVSEEDKRTMVSLWQQVRNDEYMIHTLDKDGKLLNLEESYFDRYLLAECSSEPIRSARIVGSTLCKIWDDHSMNCTIGDSFLFYRLNELGKEGVIEITERSDDPDRANSAFTVRKLH